MTVGSTTGPAHASSVLMQTEKSGTWHASHLHPLGRLETLGRGGGFPAWLRALKHDGAHDANRAASRARHSCRIVSLLVPRRQRIEGGEFDAAQRRLACGRLGAVCVPTALPLPGTRPRLLLQGGSSHAVGLFRTSALKRNFRGPPAAGHARDGG